MANKRFSGPKYANGNYKAQQKAYNLIIHALYFQDQQIGFMVLEAFVPSFGALGIGGAVAFVAGMIGGLDGYQVRLVHVVRGASPDDEKIASENGLDDTGAVFDEAVSILTKGGMAPENISTRTIGGVLSRAGAIVNAAEKGDWGTIVVGRRGWSSVSDFFIGRVSNKVVHAGRKDTVWIVT